MRTPLGLFGGNQQIIYVTTPMLIPVLRVALRKLLLVAPLGHRSARCVEAAAPS